MSQQGHLQGRFDRFNCEAVYWLKDKVLVILKGEDFVMKEYKSPQNIPPKCKEGEHESSSYEYLELPLCTERWSDERGTEYLSPQHMSIKTVKDLWENCSWRRHHGTYCPKCLSFLVSG